jgi:hypothetical protein
MKTYLEVSLKITKVSLKTQSFCSASVVLLVVVVVLLRKQSSPFISSRYFRLNWCENVN